MKIIDEDKIQWNPDELFEELIKIDFTKDINDMPKLRCFVEIAEDYNFTAEQNEILSPLLLNFAKRFRDSDDHSDQTFVWSALRTGASMLHNHQADCLIELLEPGHNIDTVKVTVKMIGKIFETQPPEEHPVSSLLSNEVFKIAKGVLNHYALISPDCSTLATLSVSALASMRSELVIYTISTIKKLNIKWFTCVVIRNLEKLRKSWIEKEACETNLKFLDNIIKKIRK